ncbi:MAG: hypothetical protein WAO83_14310 [Fuerstiella sp.]|mgnify:CR=1 FL=1
MKLKHLIQNLGRGCSAMALFGAAMASDALLTNTTSFRIPFAVDNVDGTQVSGSAILFSSLNGAAVMERIQTVDASSGGFQFNAPADGRYGFAVRLIDASGRPVGNDGRLQPEMEVIVDTVAPELSFEMSDIGNGEIALSWSASETGISPGSLKIEYAEGTDGRWKDLNVTPAASGHTVIKSQPGTSVSVRGFISDLAGNQGGGSSQAVLSSPARELAYPANPPNGATQQSMPGTNQAVGPNPFYNPPPQQAPAYGQPNSAGQMQIQHPTQAQQQSQTATPLVPQASPATQAQPTYQQFPIPAAQAPVVQAPVVQAPVVQAPVGLPEPAQKYEYFPTPTIRGNRQPFNGGFASSPTSVPAMQTSTYSNSSYPDMPAGSSSLGSMLSASGVVTGSHQVVNNRVFDIDYQVADVGPSGVGAVELFVTENNGREWFKYGVDGDLTSPFQVDTRGEGTFGFAVRVKSGLGFSDPPPQPGDLPDIVVVVDQTPPVAELSVPQVVVDGGGRVRMSWRISDPNHSATPVRLESAETTSGPWTPVFDWQADQGGYEMPIRAGMANRMYFRLLVRDSAGNVTAVQTNQPVLIDQQRPTATLLRVQSVSRTRR